MKYERLTSTYTTEDGEKMPAYINPRTCAVYVSETIFRLAELEDKIERGELISTVQAEQGEQEIAYFVKHNAAVRKQAVIEFAVRLKKKADSYNDEENYIDRSVMYTDIDDLVTEVCGK